MTEVIISHGAPLAICAEVALGFAKRAKQPAGVQWGEVRFYVEPTDTLPQAVQRFHTAAAVLRQERETSKHDIYKR